MNEILNYSIGSLTVGKIVAGIAVFLVGYFVVKILIRLIKKLLDRNDRIDGTVKTLIMIILKVALYFVLAIIVVDAMGVSSTSLVAVFSVVGLAFSLAAESALANLAGGFIILTMKPFSIGDFVTTAGQSGTVKQLGLFYTQLCTADNKAVFIPNGEISSKEIVNFSHMKERRVELKVNASYDDPIRDVKNAIYEAIEAIPDILKEPAEPFVGVNSYGESSIEYVVRVWTLNSNYWNVHFGLTEGIKESFDKNGIEMTYNHLNVHLVSGVNGEEK